jgi:sarcosine oxidase gamma subunit
MTVTWPGPISTRRAECGKSVPCVPGMAASAGRNHIAQVAPDKFLIADARGFGEVTREYVKAFVERNKIGR